MNGSSVFGLFFLVETLSNTLRGSKKNTRKPIQGCNLCFFLDDVWFIILLMTNDSKNVGQKDLSIFPRIMFFNLLVLGGFLWFMMVCFFSVWLLVIDVWWFVESDIFFLMISQACKIWMMKFYPLSQWLGCRPNDLDVVPMTWMLSQVGQYPELSQLLHSMFQPQNLMPIAFRWHVQKGEEKTSQHIPKKKPGGHFFGPGDGNPRISFYVISNTSCITYVKLYLHDAVYITNRRNVIWTVYESAFNVWS